MTSPAPVKPPHDIAAHSVSVVVPVYGCRPCLEDLVERLTLASAQVGTSFEIILVDDHSPDGAWQRIAELASRYSTVRGIRLARNFGQHSAISAGLRYATGDVVVVMDCDLQDLPEEIPHLLGALNGEIEVVLAQRINRQDTWFKRLGSRWFYRTLGWLTDTRYDATTANFGAYTRKVVDTINAMPEVDRFFPLLVRWTGFASATVEVTHAARADGQSSYRLKTLLQMALRVALSFSDKPLRLVIKGALLMAVIALGIAVYAIVQYMHGDIRVAGFTSIIASVWLIGSAIMFCLGIIGLYLGRLHEQSKGRPPYIVWQDTRAS